MIMAGSLENIGYSKYWAGLFEPLIKSGLEPARVARSDRGSFLVVTKLGVIRAITSTNIIKTAKNAADLPAVGDWVVVSLSPDKESAIIERVLPRTSAITRGDPGKTSKIQVLAANIDIVFIVHPIAEQPNLRRIERELSIAWESGAQPVIVLTKADLSKDAQAAYAAVDTISFDTEILLVNALKNEDLKPIADKVKSGQTSVLIGPSGVGKSTIINNLLGEQRQATKEVRFSDGRGRHTTVARELIQMTGGGVLIDTPGLRALGLTGYDEGLANTFPEIEELAAGCRFKDCQHQDEPGCAVKDAIESGKIPVERLSSYLKLKREAEVASAKGDARLRAEAERKWKTISKSVKDYYKNYKDK